jgi:hypothetical protein
MILNNKNILKKKKKCQINMSHIVSYILKIDINIEKLG